MCKNCDIPDSYGDYTPCCDWTGVCSAYPTDDNFSTCVCCGAEMQLDEGSFWRHHSQMELPFEQRGTSHYICSIDEI